MILALACVCLALGVVDGVRLVLLSCRADFQRSALVWVDLAMECLHNCQVSQSVAGHIDMPLRSTHD